MIIFDHSHLFIVIVRENVCVWFMFQGIVGSVVTLNLIVLLRSTLSSSKPLFKRWGLGDGSIPKIKDFVYGGTTDNASNVCAATKLLKIKQIGCWAHKTNLAVKKAVGGKFIVSKHPDDMSDDEAEAS